MQLASNSTTASNDSEAVTRLPTEVQEILARLTLILREAGAISAIVTGSTARGEMSYVRLENDLLLRSDIELYVVCDRPKKFANLVKQDVEKLESRYSERWPEFHIDIAYLTARQLSMLPHWIRHFEIKANGWVLWGENTVAQIPDVTLSNLDWRELNDVVLWRLMGLVARLTTSWLAGDRKLSDGESQAMARSLLDITTWGLPGIGVLLSTYQERVDYWKEPANADALASVSRVSGRTLDACFRSREMTTCEVSSDDLFESAIGSWCYAYDLVIGTRPCPHRGCGRGFTQGDILRRTRAAYRVRSFGRNLTLRTLRRGTNNVAAEWAQRLASVALDLRKACHAASNSADSASCDGAKVVCELDLQKWDASRRRLVAYVDAATMRDDWARYLFSDAMHSSNRID